MVMNATLLQELKNLRNEIAHGRRRADVESLGRRLQELGISVPPGELQWFVADLLRGLGDVGEYFVPPVVLNGIRFLLEDRSTGAATSRFAPHR
jgi:hypothetical protein